MADFWPYFLLTKQPGSLIKENRAADLYKYTKNSWHPERIIYPGTPILLNS